MRAAPVTMGVPHLAPTHKSRAPRTPRPSRSDESAAPKPPAQSATPARMSSRRSAPSTSAPTESVREEQLYGLRATLAAARHRGDAIVRAYVAEDLVKRSKEVGGLLSRLSSTNTAYHLVSPLELDRIAKTVHHEGIVLLVRARPVPSGEEVLRRLTQSSSKQRAAKPWQRAVQPPLVLIHGVRNAHNIGAIVRSAAFFGVRTLFASPGDAAEPLGLYSPAAYRMAEGAMEGVELVPLAADAARTPDIVSRDETEAEEAGGEDGKGRDGWSPVVPERQEARAAGGGPTTLAAVQRLKRAGFMVVATSSSAAGRVSLFDVKLQGKLRTSPLALVFGSESTGLPRALIREASATVEGTFCVCQCL